MQLFIVTLAGQTNLIDVRTWNQKKAMFTRNGSHLVQVQVRTVLGLFKRYLLSASVHMGWSSNSPVKTPAYQSNQREYISCFSHLSLRRMYEAVFNWRRTGDVRS